MPAVLSPTGNIATSADSAATQSPGIVSRYFASLFDITGEETSWNHVASLALLSLLLLWAWRVYSTWATWGDLSIDCGREMYVPAMLAQGKMLYRDVWFGYLPAAPYVNSALFRLFGLRLEVLYWAGSLAALGCATLLFLAGRRLSSWLAGWTAAAIVLFQSFHSWHFSFPLPYSFSSVYGCLTACLFLWFAIRAAASPAWGWMFGAASTAAIAFLFKLEFGAACYLALFMLIIGRGRQRAWRSVWTDLLAVLPGLALCGAVITWMLSIHGFSFITKENLASTWPASFLMQTYGRAWLEKSGLAITPSALGLSAGRTLFFAATLLAGWRLLRFDRRNRRAILLTATLVAALLLYFVFALHGRPQSALGALCFPMDMVLYVAIAAALAGWYFWRAPSRHPVLPLVVLFAFSALLGLRILLRNTPAGYAIYYNGPAILSFLILARGLIAREGSPRRIVLRLELLVSVATLAVVALYSVQYTANRSDLVALTTERGAIFVPQQVADNYRAAVAFMKQHASRGESVLSVPEDTSLYFFAGVSCPTRVFFFTPGILAPGKMTQDFLREIDRQPVRYLLWSNRTFPDYGVPNFGADYDRAFGDYLTSHYHRVGPLVPHSDLGWQVSFTLWERNR